MKRSLLPVALLATVASLLPAAPASAGTHASTNDSAVASTDLLVSPNSDPFYTPPDGFARYQPGTILRSRPVTLLGAMQPTLGSAYQLLYRTTDATGRPTTTVATLMTPAAPASGPRKLVSYQTAYDSLTLNCAPSYTMRGGNNGGSTQQLESIFIGQELAQGWDVVVPDYEGPQSEWAVGPMLGQATLDGIRAAEAFPPGMLDGSDAPVAMNGYSGGAIASNWAEALAPEYAPELQIVAVAAGGIFPDVDYTVSTLDGSPWYGVQLGVLVAAGRAYPALAPSLLLNATGQALAAQDAQDADGCAGAATNAPGGNAAEYTVYPTSEALAAAPRVKQVLDNLNLDRAPVPTAPSFFYNAIGDELAHIGPVDQMVARYCAAGATIDYYRDPVASGHVPGLFAYWPLALQYLKDRFGGEPAPTTC